MIYVGGSPARTFCLISQALDLLAFAMLRGTCSASESLPR